MELPEDLINFVKIIPGNISYLGSTTLTQFKVIGHNFKLAESETETETETEMERRLIIELVLQRMHLYHMTNTYLPTTCLLSKTCLKLIYKF
jgi:hypothetical protein